MELTNSKIILHQQTEPRLATVDKDLGSYFGVDQGVLVLAVPEDAGDLRSGDILLSVDGKPTTDLTIARALLAQAGDRAVSARIPRHGKEQTAQIQPRSFVRGAQRAHNIHIESDGDGVEIIVEEDAQDGSR